MPGVNVDLPANGWRPRRHQFGLWTYLSNGGKRAVEIAHRRWGKDEVSLNWAAVALHQRVGNWWHCLPEYAQARKAIWNQVNPHTGRRRIDEAFPVELRKRTLEQEMMIEFHNGSVWQVIGSDNYNHLVGASPLGITFSEWAIAMPAAWAYFSPILDENDGTAIFITTPRGKNHAYQTLRAAQEDPANWYAEIQSVIESGYDQERVERQRREYRRIYGDDAGDAMIEQEFYCSFEAAVLGAIYGKEISILRRLGRVRPFQINPAFPVHRAWDLGRGRSDAMAIWFFQWIGGEIRYVDYLEGFQHGIGWYADQIKAKGYPKGPKDDPAVDYVPHDAKVASMELETTRILFMIQCGLNPRLVPDHYVEDRHSAARHVLRRSWFHPRCADALEVLAAYQYEYDEKAMTFKKVPKHNYASHNADSFGYSAVAYKEPLFVRPEGSKGRATYILTPGDPNAGPLGPTIPDRPQITLDDLWMKHREQLNAARRSG